jgi:hypothetical protein
MIWIWIWIEPDEGEGGGGIYECNIISDKYEPDELFIGH